MLCCRNHNGFTVLVNANKKSFGYGDAFYCVCRLLLFELGIVPGFIYLAFRLVCHGMEV